MLCMCIIPGTCLMCLPGIYLACAYYVRTVSIVRWSRLYSCILVGARVYNNLVLIGIK